MPSYINEAKNYLLARLKDHEEIQKIVLGENLAGIIYNNKIEIICL